MTEQARDPHLLLKWLTPGIGVKRWFGLLFAGVTLLGLAFALLLLEFFRANPSPAVEYLLTLGGAPLWLRAGLAGAIGVASVSLAILRINRAILAPLDVSHQSLVKAMVEHRHRQRGPRIVALGGGTGLPVLLRGLKAYTTNLTAIVTVADDGGSSGRLRRDLGILPPGDFRNNIAALARDEGLMSRLFQYRFGEGGLEGHSFGNLFITALSGVTGSFEQALAECSRVLAIQGKVLPSALANVTLVAELREDGGNSTRRVVGESAIPENKGIIERIFLQPDDIPAYPEAVRAILSADLIVLGPGSLFTSILPNLLVSGIAEAIRRSRALKIYVCNVATQRGETDGFSMHDHVSAIEQQAGESLFDVVLVNDEFPPLAPDSNFAYVHVKEADKSNSKMRIYASSLIDETHPWRHDPDRLAKALIDLLAESGHPMA